MKRFKLVIVLVAVAFLAYTQSTTADTLTDQEKTLALGESLLNSVVIIKTQRSEGTGFYISPNELITDYHVIRGEVATIEKSDGKACETSLVYEDHDLDLALLKTSCEGTPLKLATSVKVGQTVLMMGNPDSQYFFLSKGIVSNLKHKGYIYYDAKTIEGNSGSPIVNLNGEVVGVARWVYKVSEKIAAATDYESLARFIAYVNHLKGGLENGYSN